MSRTLHIVVMRGGISAEREVSLASGAAVTTALRERGHVVTEVDPRPGEWRLPAGAQVVFLALHGAYGEDGAIQRELEATGVPYTGCDAESSRLAFDKCLAKQRFVEAGVPTPRFATLNGDTADAWPADWRPPAILKPACQGSSVGLEFIESEAEWPAALAAARRHGDRLLLEEWVRGREVTVGLLGEEVLPIVEIRPRSGRYDFSSKYTPGSTDYFCPADFPPAQASRIQELGRAAFEALGGRDYGRVDLMAPAEGDPTVLEVNTLPGMTETSLLPKAAQAAGWGFSALCQRMIDLALRRSSIT